MQCSSGSGQDPCTSISLGDPSAALLGAQRFCATPGCGTIIPKLKALGA